MFPQEYEELAKWTFAIYLWAGDSLKVYGSYMSYRPQRVKQFWGIEKSNNFVNKFSYKLTQQVKLLFNQVFLDQMCPKEYFRTLFSSLKQTYFELQAQNCQNQAILGGSPTTRMAHISKTEGFWIPKLVANHFLGRYSPKTPILQI